MIWMVPGLKIQSAENDRVWHVTRKAKKGNRSKIMLSKMPTFAWALLMMASIQAYYEFPYQSVNLRIEYTAESNNLLW